MVLTWPSGYRVLAEREENRPVWGVELGETIRQAVEYMGLKLCLHSGWNSER